MFCKIQRSNLTKKITLFIFDIKNVCKYSSNIKLKRCKISFPLLANYSVMMLPHVCVKNLSCSHLVVYTFFNSYILLKIDIKEFPNWMGICIIIKNKKIQNFIKKKKCFIHSIIFLPRSKFFFKVRVKLSNVKTMIVL